MASEDGDAPDCPLCCTVMDLTDRSVQYCGCGYQMCLWCYHHILEEASKENLPARCPNCRAEYDQEKITMQHIDAEQLEEEKRKLKEKDKPSKASSSSSSSSSRVSRAGLANIRVVQPNLVYAVGLPMEICREDVLGQPEFFGQFGRTIKISVNRSNQYASALARHGPTGSAYVTFRRPEDALRCIKVVDGAAWAGKPVRACFGTTKYCSAFLKGLPCNNPECLYLHEIGGRGGGGARGEARAGGWRARRGAVERLAAATGRRARARGWAAGVVPRVSGLAGRLQGGQGAVRRRSLARPAPPRNPLTAAPRHAADEADCLTKEEVAAGLLPARFLAMGAHNTFKPRLTINPIPNAATAAAHAAATAAVAAGQPPAAVTAAAAAAGGVSRPAGLQAAHAGGGAPRVLTVPISALSRNVGQRQRPPPPPPPATAAPPVGSPEDEHRQLDAAASSSPWGSPAVRGGLAAAAGPAPPAAAGAQHPPRTSSGTSWASISAAPPSTPPAASSLGVAERPAAPPPPRTDAEQWPTLGGSPAALAAAASSVASPQQEDSGEAGAPGPGRLGPMLQRAPSGPTGATMAEQLARAASHLQGRDRDVHRPKKLLPLSSPAKLKPLGKAPSLPQRLGAHAHVVLVQPTAAASPAAVQPTQAKQQQQQQQQSPKQQHQQHANGPAAGRQGEQGSAAGSGREAATGDGRSQPAAPTASTSSSRQSALVQPASTSAPAMELAAAASAAKAGRLKPPPGFEQAVPVPATALPNGVPSRLHKVVPPPGFGGPAGLAPGSIGSGGSSLGATPSTSQHTSFDGAAVGADAASSFTRLGGSALFGSELAAAPGSTASGGSGLERLPSAHDLFGGGGTGSERSLSPCLSLGSTSGSLPVGAAPSSRRQRSRFAFAQDDDEGRPPGGGGAGGPPPAFGHVAPAAVAPQAQAAQPDAGAFFCSLFPGASVSVSSGGSGLFTSGGGLGASPPQQQRPYAHHAQGDSAASDSGLALLRQLQGGGAAVHAGRAVQQQQQQQPGGLSSAFHDPAIVGLSARPAAAAAPPGFAGQQAARRMPPPGFGY
eukprot:scaffold8.g1407.t1